MTDIDREDDDPRCLRSKLVSATAVHAVLLAAGFSRRFGPENKLLALMDGKPLARHTLDLVTSLHAKGMIRRIFYVYACEEVAALAAGLPVTLVHNPHPELGQQMSIRLALEAASTGTAGCAPTAPFIEYYLFCPCDQPRLTAEAVERILSYRSPGCIVEPRIDGQPSSPKLFPSSLVPELMALPPYTPPRTLLRTHRERVISVDFPPDSAFLFSDVDYQ